MNKLARFMVPFMAAGLMTAMASTAFAATRNSTGETKIGKMNLTFEIDNPKGGDSVEDPLKVTTTTEGVLIDDAYYEDADDEWTRGDIPTIKVTMTAEEGYYFGNYSFGRLSGVTATSKSIKKDGDKYHAIATIKLKKVNGTLDDIEDPDWNGSVATWDDIEGASYYQVRLYRDGKKITTISTDKTSFDFYEWMTKSGDYTFEVKAKANKSSEDSEWSGESDSLDVSSNDVYTGTRPTQTNYRGSGSSSSSSSLNLGNRNNSVANNGPAASNTYSSPNGPGNSANSGSARVANGWRQEAGGWRYGYNNADVIYSWLQDGGHWYFIGQDGYMKTGWQLIQGVWYYFKPENGGPMGAMQTDWLKINDAWYCFAKNGAMMTGFQNINGYNFYFTESGALLMNAAAPNGQMAGVDGVLH